MKSRRFISLSPPPDWTRYQIARYTIAFWGGATHAWLRVYLPGAGWVDFDPTNSIIGNRNLIRVAVAWDPAQALPLWGSFIGYASSFLGMEVTVSVVDETRPSKTRSTGRIRSTTSPAT